MKKLLAALLFAIASLASCESTAVDQNSQQRSAAYYYKTPDGASRYVFTGPDGVTYHYRQP
jgi:hypothetical protein